MTLPAVAVADLPGEPADPIVLERRRRYTAATIAENTRLAYTKAARRWADWCETRSLTPIGTTPAAVADYLLELADAGRRVSTVEQTLAAIVWLHRQSGAGFDGKHPHIANALKGMRNTHGRAQHGKAALVGEDIRRIVASIPAGHAAGIRDRALILLGFAGAFRRSELVGLDLGERGTGIGFVEQRPQGWYVHLAKSKTDQEGQGLDKGIVPGDCEMTCPVAALCDWVTVGVITRATPLFRPIDRHGRIGAGRLSDRAAVEILKARCAGVGIDPRSIAGHSLRAGHVTQAIDFGITVEEIMRQTGHKKVETLHRYVRRNDVFRRSSSRGLGL